MFAFQRSRRVEDASFRIPPVERQTERHRFAQATRARSIKSAHKRRTAKIVAARDFAYMKD